MVKAMPSVLTNLMARLKRRRKWRLSKRDRLHTPVEQMEKLSLSSAPEEQGQTRDSTSLPHVFGEKELEFEFNPAAFIKDTNASWPGPPYDTTALFAPGIFDKPRHLKRVPKRKTSKRTVSCDERFTGPPKSPMRMEQKQMALSAKRKLPPVQRLPKPCVFGKPPTRDPPLHLLNLPGEIRNEVYRLLYVQETSMIAHFRAFMEPKKGGKTSFRRFPREPALALVCKQLQHEVMSIFYAENYFVFRLATCTYSRLPAMPTMPTAQEMAQWMPKLGFAHSLTRLHLEIKAWGPEHQWFALVYTLRKSTVDGTNKYTISANLADFADWCLCTERAIKTRAEALFENAEDSDNLVTLLNKLTALRSEIDPGTGMSRTPRSVATRGPFGTRTKCAKCGMANQLYFGSGP